MPAEGMVWGLLAYFAAYGVNRGGRARTEEKIQTSRRVLFSKKKLGYCWFVLKSLLPYFSHSLCQFVPIRRKVSVLILLPGSGSGSALR